MRDDELVEFLQWALPRLDRKWSGYRKVRGQVGGRIRGRLVELGLGDLNAYREYLEENADEWDVLDSFCRITISKFYRGRATWDRLREQVLPRLAERAMAEGRECIHAWSIGCASGEEPYTLRLCWELDVGRRFADIGLDIVATDADEHMLERARAACYPAGCLSELPKAWRDSAFEESGDAQDPWCLREECRRGIEFERQDVRREQPEGPFDLVFCRYVVLIYFEEAVQREVLGDVSDQMREGGALVVGPKEELPEGCGFEPWDESRKIYRRSPDK